VHPGPEGPGEPRARPPDHPAAPELFCSDKDRDCDGVAGAEVDDASYFLSTIELRAGSAPSMARWRKKLFIATSTITADAAEYFHLPRERTLIIGSTVEL